MLSKFGLPLPLLHFALCEVFQLIRRSHFSRQCRSRFRLTGSSGLWEMHPSRQR
jgi:hypothetical protein